MAPLTAKLAKRMETVMKPYKFEESIWLLPFSMVKSFLASLTVRWTPTNNDNVSFLVRRGIEGQKCIYMYIKAVIYLRNSYAKTDVIAKKASEAESFKNAIA